ncbi:NAD-dependent epimerase/dehydratase family protein [Candidatus Pelagibacter communis]|uniref:NAD-dependent epimerase/dehydratase family protein n=1 Tax=Pelagibacter ubique TaxID=198252 RepID=UPI00094D41B6|nr:NAD-dependent epimerase/dehydratase family protein [Candidatus Pelagibacter ubique]
MILITGSTGLIGFDASLFYLNKKKTVIGIDNDLRSYFFGKKGSNKWKELILKKNKKYNHFSIDIRNKRRIFKIFSKYGKRIETVIHTAAQPSHDWAAKEPFTDFEVNANGTLNLLEALRIFCPEASFIFTSTNKVYGDRPNYLPLKEKKLRFEIDKKHQFYKKGIDESMSLDQTTHSIFGASKTGADLLVQEYGRYFNLKTVTFRGGCLTGENHSGAELHGFLSFLVKSIISGKKYSVFGYKGKQVRDNIHSIDVVNAFDHFIKKPLRGGKVYNLGGGRENSCSILEAIKMIEKISGKKSRYKILNKNRVGDHIWWISNNSKFKKDFPKWKIKVNLKKSLEKMIAHEIKNLG